MRNLGMTFCQNPNCRKMGCSTTEPKPPKPTESGDSKGRR